MRYARPDYVLGERDLTRAEREWREDLKELDPLDSLVLDLCTKLYAAERENKLLLRIIAEYEAIDIWDDGVSSVEYDDRDDTPP